jgi:hypothetical protein
MHGEVNVNSKAIAILIICLGVIALIASAALGSIIDQNEALAGWSAEAGTATASPVLAGSATAGREIQEM